VVERIFEELLKKRNLLTDCKESLFITEKSANFAS